jgi:hypothetical protein
MRQDSEIKTTEITLLKDQLIKKNQHIKSASLSDPHNLIEWEDKHKKTDW